MGGVIRARLASSNPDKLAELRAVLADWELELLDADGFPPEEGDSYYANARAKADYGRLVADADVWVLGEDSGIEVDALGGDPGVHSARWSERPIEELLERLEGVENRRARYVCELVCLTPERDELRGRGTLAGSIAEQPRGHEGFGYDPIFVPAGNTATVAELGDAWKREQSHRARAARALLDVLGARLAPEARPAR
jgi:XTP/dITP diphosphohydrolase